MRGSVCVLTGEKRLGLWGHGQRGLGQADARDLRWIPAASGQQMPLMVVTQGPASWQWGARFFSLSFVPGRHGRPEGAPCPLQPESQKRGGGGGLPWRIPLLGWAAVCRDHQVWPARVCGGRDKSRVPEPTRRRAGAGCPSHFAAVMLGDRVGTFAPKLWLSPGHLGLLPALQ